MRPSVEIGSGRSTPSLQASCEQSPDSEISPPKEVAGATSNSIKRKVALKLAIVTRHMRKHFDDAIAELGVTRSQWTVIAVVSSSPGANQRLIAETLEISEAAAGRLVDRLITEGMVERKRHADDRRAHAIYLTQKGEELTGTLAEVATISEETTFAGITVSQLEQMSALLDAISANLGNMEPY